MLCEHVLSCTSCSSDVTRTEARALTCSLSGQAGEDFLESLMPVGSEVTPCSPGLGQPGFVMMMVKHPLCGLYC